MKTIDIETLRDLGALIPVPSDEPMPIPMVNIGSLICCDHPGIWRVGRQSDGLIPIYRVDARGDTALNLHAMVQPVKLIGIDEWLERG